MGANLSGSAESRGWLRSIFWGKPVQPATWKLRLTGNLEYHVVLTRWKDAQSTLGAWSL